MTSPSRHKEIQVQRPAQSLQAFQERLDAGSSPHMRFVKPALVAAGMVLVGALAFFGYRSWASGAVVKHETALAELLLAVQGTPEAPIQPADLEKRMRENLPKLEALARSAPSSRRAEAARLLATWRLELDGKGGVAPRTDDPWSRLRTAQRQVALGQGQEALATLAPLRTAAAPGEAWGSLYWKTLLEARSLQGEREPALKDYAEYKQRFRERADVQGMERILAGI